MTNEKKRKKAHFKIINENHDKCKSRGMPEIPQMKIMTNAKHNGDAFSSLNQKNFVLKFSFYISHIMICDRRIKAEWRVENKTNESTKKASGTIFISLNVLGFSYVSCRRNATHVIN